MPDISTVIRSLREDGSIFQTANNPRLSFRDANDRVLVGAQLMPEIQQPLNRYDEENFSLIDMVADDSDRYSPVKLKGEAIELAAFEVTLGEISLGKQLSPKTYDELVRLAAFGGSMEQMAQTLLDFVGSLSRGLAAKDEIHRWNAIVSGEMTRIVGGTPETIAYPNATGQRTTLANAWSDDAYDPFEDFVAAQKFGADMGYDSVSRIITSRKVVNILARNMNMVRRSSGIRPSEDSYVGVASPARTNGYLQTEGFPAIETYEARYTEQQGRARVRNRYMPEDAIVFVFDTGQPNDLALELAEEDGREYVPAAASSSIGYTGIGTVSGHSAPGKRVYLNSNEGETVRPRVIGESAATTLPVFEHPNAFKAYTGVS